MLNFFDGFGRYLKFKDCLIDNLTFRLHYQYTFFFLCIASLLQTAQQYFGNPIDCDVDGVPGDLFNTFCMGMGLIVGPCVLTTKLQKFKVNNSSSAHTMLYDCTMARYRSQLREYYRSSS